MKKKRMRYETAECEWIRIEPEDIVAVSPNPKDPNQLEWDLGSTLIIEWRKDV